MCAMATFNCRVGYGITVWPAVCDMLDPKTLAPKPSCHLALSCFCRHCILTQNLVIWSEISSNRHFKEYRMQSPYLHRMRLYLLFLFCGATLSVSTSIVSTLVLALLKDFYLMTMMFAHKSRFKEITCAKAILPY